MKRYLLRRAGGTLRVETLDVSPTDNIALPADASVLTEEEWGLLGMSVDRLRTACTAKGLALDDQTGSIAAERESK
jgi:hypothetical protein